MITKRSFFIENYISNENYQHGGVGYTDCEKVLRSLNLKAIRLPFSQSNNIFYKVLRLIYLYFYLGFVIKKTDTIISIFPIYPKAIRQFIRLSMKLKKTKICYFVFDLDGLKCNDFNVLNRELKQLRKSNFLIVHNMKMQEYFLNLNFQQQIIRLDFFDYLCEDRKHKIIPIKNYTIAYAANTKIRNFYDEFLYADGVKFYLYGQPLTKKYPNVEEMGIFNPDELIASIKGSFGLDWEGEENSNKINILKNYSKYISHHKLSLYILCQMPIITQVGSASELLVKKYKIGITINKLSELKNSIDNISNLEYRTMQLNMSMLAMKLSKGLMTIEALQRLAIITKIK